MALLAPRRGFRWRLTTAFVLVAGLSSGILAGVSFFLVRDDRIDNFLERSLNDAEINYGNASSLTDDDPAGLETMMQRVSRRGADVVAITPTGPLLSNPNLGLDDIPSEESLSDAVGNDLTHQDALANGDPYLVVSTPRAGSVTSMHFFYPKMALERGLTDLAGLLLRVWAVVIATSALVGSILARRTLRPVARASGAALSLAEGLLTLGSPSRARMNLVSGPRLSMRWQKRFRKR